MYDSPNGGREAGPRHWEDGGGAGPAAAVCQTAATSDGLFDDVDGVMIYDYDK